MRPLKLGAAYHGNRMLHHAEEDLRDMVRNDMDLVVHTFSHTDWDRHKNRMKDMVALSQDIGLEVWVDNWGLGGPPGDKSHFLAYHPECHVYYSNGEMDPVRVCLNSEEFRKFTYQWIETVKELGAKTIFWDEPQLPQKVVQGKTLYSCCCNRCKKLYEDTYGEPMPEEATEKATEFAVNSIVTYFDDVTTYSASLGMENVICVMLGAHNGISLESIDKLCSLPHLDNIGSDPYWVYENNVDVYPFVYKNSKLNIDVSNRFQKDHNIWIQAFDNPRNKEEDIVVATEAAYDAGARTIIAWGYYGSESNDYCAKNPYLAWARTCEAMRRIKNMERDRILMENRLRNQLK